METTPPIRFAPEYELPHWPFTPPPELSGGTPGRYPVVIVGAGLAGLTLACDLATRGVPAVLLDEDDTVGVRGASSRGICYAQKSLEIFARLGIDERIRDKGITWSVGRTLSGSDEVYRFDLRSDSVSAQPPFINIQQFYVEWFLVERLQELGHADLRWKSRVGRVEPAADHVRVHVHTPAGDYVLEAAWLIDASGANSAIRQQLEPDAHIAHGSDRWCISDVRFAKPLPIERWTWTDAPFNDGRAVWQHLMADGVWRIDYQMDEHADPQDVSRPEVAAARLRQQLGPEVDFEFVWIGPYQYRDFLLDEFRHGRVLFIGDAAHVVSPFGARGGNTGIQDANNLGWKLARVLGGTAEESLIDSYHAERRAAAAENLRVTSRTARFLAPRSAVERRLRRAVLALARRFAFVRPMVDTGRMSVANAYPPSRWLPQGGHTVQNVAFDGTSVMNLLQGNSQGVALFFGAADDGLAELARRHGLAVHATAADGALARHLDVRAASVVLVRPDAYVAATLHAPDPDQLRQALETLA